MATVALLLVVLLLASMAVTFVRRRRTLVAKRGLSIGADLGTLSDQPRVRVRDVAIEGPERVRLVLAPEQAPAGAPTPISSSDLDLVVSLRDGDLGLDLLQGWQRSAQPLAIVLPPGSHIVRLRSVDDLQPLTLRRVDQP